MFPTHVGMNRGTALVNGEWRNVPHTRGDEPAHYGISTKSYRMFPTHVGMNRQTGAGACRIFYVPHTRGDEPQASQKLKLPQACSPHTWG